MVMSLKCGVDIIEIERIRASMEAGGEAFRSRVFTAAEIQYCEARKNARFESYAARFAAKEAVSKALGCGIGEALGFKDIEILKDDKGSPFVVLSQKAELLFKDMGGIEISLSLSHCKTYAVAYAVAQLQGQ